jgi:hypothetical protein
LQNIKSFLKEVLADIFPPVFDREECSILDGVPN